MKLACARGVKTGQENCYNAFANVDDWNSQHPEQTYQILAPSVMVTTKDNTIVLCHDEDTIELTGTHHNIKNMSKGKILPLRVNKDKNLPPEKFMFIDELFDVYHTRYCFYLDIKDKDYRPWHGKCRTANVIIDFLISQSIVRPNILNQVLLESTNPFVVRALIKRAKQLKVSLHIGFDYNNLGINCCCIPPLIRFLISHRTLERLYATRIAFINSEFFTAKVLEDYQRHNIEVCIWNMSIGEVRQYPAADYALI